MVDNSASNPFNNWCLDVDYENCDKLHAKICFPSWDTTLQIIIIVCGSQLFSNSVTNKEVTS